MGARCYTSSMTTGRTGALVVFGSKRGSTREVAEAIAAALRDRGVAVELRRGGERIDDVAERAVVVVGGALYRGRLHRDARRFLKRHRRDLQAMPLFVFAMGPRRPEQDAYDKARSEVDRALAKLPEIAARSTVVFGGVDRDRGVDLRDWEAIAAWAETIGAAAIGSGG